MTEEEVNMSHGLDGNGLKVLWDLITTNFALKKDINEDYLTDEEIDEICGMGGGIRPGGKYVTIKIVDMLPVEGDTSVLYLVPNGKTEGEDIYDEYIWNNNAWEKVGGGSGEAEIESISDDTIIELVEK